MGSMQNFPVSRRSDRPYSSDVDTINRSGRGGPRGRGRGRGNPRYHPGNNIHNDNEQINFINIDQKKMSQRGGGGRGNGGRTPRGAGGGGIGGIGGSSGNSNNGGIRNDIDRHNDRRPPRPASASTSSTPK